MQSVEIGKSSEGRPQMAAIITAPENFKLLKKYQDISMRLAKGEGLTDAQAHELAKEGKGRRLVRRRPPRHRSPRREPADRDDLSAHQPERRRDEAHPARRHHPRRARQSRRHAARRRLVHEGQGYARADDEHSASLQQVRRPRRQPRLVHVEPGRDEEREPLHVLGLAPGDHVQPSPDRSRGHGDVLAAVPRSVQLQLRPHDRDGARHGRRGDPPAAARAQHAGLHDALRARATRRGGTAVSARSATSRASSAFSRRRSAIRRPSESRSSPTSSSRAAICRRR